MPIDFIVGLPHLNEGPSPEARLALQEILLDIQRDARLRAEKAGAAASRRSRPTGQPAASTPAI